MTVPATVPRALAGTIRHGRRGGKCRIPAESCESVHPARFQNPLLERECGFKSLLRHRSPERPPG
jgi:hypothetical protein